MTKSYFGEIESARQYFNKICDLRITERDFMTAILNYTSGLIEAKKMDSAMVAGAVICGAMFGDKLSPLSDTTNLAPAVSGAKLGDHIRAMFWTTIPTYIITLIIFTVLGIQQTSGGYTAGDISNYITELNGEFHLGAVTLIPAILIIVLLLCKVNAISALGISSFAAGAVSFFVQHATLQSIIQTAYSGYTTTIEEGVLQSILNRGGMRLILISELTDLKRQMNRDTEWKLQKLSLESFIKMTV